MRTTHGKQLLILLTLAIATIGLAAGTVAGQGSEESDEEQLTLMPSANTAELIQAPGVEQLQANCLACHTVTPILLHNGFSPEVWDAEVQKMRNTYGAEISDEDAAWIIGYLQQNYSSDPVSAENMLLNGVNASADEEPVFEGAEGTPESEGPPEITPEASPVDG